MSGAPHVRPRRLEDVPALVSLLLGQQHATRYPLRDPFPVPLEQFLHTEDADAAWVAELDGEVIGHVCRTRGRHANTDDVAMQRTCAGAHRCDVDELGWVSTLYVDLARGGRGVGRMLLDTVVGDILAARLRPCLEVLPLHAAALALYEAAGWRTVASTRPAWLVGALGDEGPDVRLMVLDADSPSRLRLIEAQGLHRDEVKTLPGPDVTRHPA